MAIIDPSPSPDELKNLAAVFQTVESELQRYLTSPAGQADPNFTALTSDAISINNASDMIAVMQLDLATAQGTQAVAVINDATAELQRAIELRSQITRDLGIIQSVVSFGAAIAAGDIDSILSSGDTLYGQLTAAAAPGDAAPVSSNASSTSGSVA